MPDRDPTPPFPWRVVMLRFRSAEWIGSRRPRSPPCRAPMSNSTAYWEKIYRTKQFDGVSWYAPHLAESIRLITRLMPNRDAAIIDIGGGESTLVDDLLGLGYTNLSVLDISSTAIDFTRMRLGA